MQSIAVPQLNLTPIFQEIHHIIIHLWLSLKFLLPIIDAASDCKKMLAMCLMVIIVSTWAHQSNPHPFPWPLSSPWWTKILSLKWNVFAKQFRTHVDRLDEGLVIYACFVIRQTFHLCIHWIDTPFMVFSLLLVPRNLIQTAPFQDKNLE